MVIIIFCRQQTLSEFSELKESLPASADLERAAQSINNFAQAIEQRRKALIGLQTLYRRFALVCFFK